MKIQPSFDLNANPDITQLISRPHSPALWAADIYYLTLIPGFPIITIISSRKFIHHILSGNYVPFTPFPEAAIATISFNHPLKSMLGMKSDGVEAKMHPEGEA